MAPQTLNSPATILRPNVRISASTSPSFPTGKRSNKRPRNYVEEKYLAMCLVKLARGSPSVIKRPASLNVKYITSLEEENIVLATMDVKKDQEPTSLNAHTCNVCNKSFSSHQALGGHKASHRSKTPAIMVEDRNLIKNVKSSGKVHECSTCHKTFASGQALGGHMRKHYKGVIRGAKNRSSDGSAETKSHCNEGERDFDLNVPLTDLYCDEAESVFMRRF